MASDLAAFGKDIELAIAGLVPPDERRRQIQAAANDLLRAAEQEIRAAGGGTPRHKTVVDGRTVESLDGIDPDRGTVAFRFEAGIPVETVQAVLDLIRENSPVLTGRYRDSHRVYADGQDVTEAMPIAQERADRIEEFVIMPTVPYGRKLEEQPKRRGSTGVYEGVAALAGHRYANQARVGYGFRSPILPYVAGGANRAERAAIRNQPSRRAAMRAERTTRLPCITITALGR